MRTRAALLVLICGLVILSGCERPAPDVATLTPVPTQVGMPNPASVYCEEQGGRVEIRQDADGNQYGVCVFPDGSECDEWAFYRGDCAPAGTATPVPTDTLEPATIAPTDTVAAPTATVAPPTDTATIAPTDTLAPTDTPEPTATEAPLAPSFSQGLTYLSVQGRLLAGNSWDYALQLRQGQWLIAQVASPAQDVVLSVLPESGAALLSQSEQAMSWQGRAPSTQRYTIRALNMGAESDYSLDLILPEPIQFEAGKTAAVREGSLRVGESHHYVLRANAGQYLVVDLSAVSGSYVTLRGLEDGRVLLDNESGARHWQGQLPATQDYLLKVTSAAATDYGLSLVIPQVIHFAPNATSARIEGDLEPFQAHHYTLRGQAGQYLLTTLTPPNEVNLTVYGLIDGAPLIRSAGAVAATQAQLTLSQDYMVVVAAGEAASSYALDLIVPQRIQFEAGATQIQFQDVLPANRAKHYVLGAQAGQTMRVALASENVALQIDVNGIVELDPSDLLGGGRMRTMMWEGELWADQDYLVKIVAPAEPMAFTCTITIQ